MSDAKNAKTILPATEIIGAVLGIDDLGRRAQTDLIKAPGTITAGYRRHKQRRCSNRDRNPRTQISLSMAASVSVSL